MFSASALSLVLMVLVLAMLIIFYTYLLLIQAHVVGLPSLLQVLVKWKTSMTGNRKGEMSEREKPKRKREREREVGRERATFYLHTGQLLDI